MEHGHEQEVSVRHLAELCEEILWEERGASILRSTHLVVHELPIVLVSMELGIDLESAPRGFRALIFIFTICAGVGERPLF